MLELLGENVKICHKHSSCTLSYGCCISTMVYLLKQKNKTKKQSPTLNKHTTRKLNASEISVEY